GLPIVDDDRADLVHRDKSTGGLTGPGDIVEGAAKEIRERGRGRVARSRLNEEAGEVRYIRTVEGGDVQPDLDEFLSLGRGVTGLVEEGPRNWVRVAVHECVRRSCRRANRRDSARGIVPGPA